MEEVYYPVEIESKLSSVNKYAIVQFGRSIEKIVGNDSLELLANDFVKRFFSRLDIEGCYSENKKQGIFHLMYDFPSVSRITYVEPKKGEKTIEVIILKRLIEKDKQDFEKYVSDFLKNGPKS